MLDDQDALKTALIEQARGQGAALPGAEGMPAGGQLAQVPPTEQQNLGPKFAQWLMRLLAPNARSLMAGEPAAPATDLPTTPGKVPSQEDPRPMGAAIEGLQQIPAMAAPEVAPAMMARAAGPALAGAERAVPAMAKAIPANTMVNTGLAASGTMAGVPGPAQAESAPEQVPVGQRPKSGEWWRTQRAPPPTMLPFTAPTMSPEELSPYDEPKFAPPKGWQGGREQKQNYEGPQSYYARMQSLNRERETREGRRLEASERKTAVARKDHESEFSRESAAYQKEQERLDRLDAEYKEANENFRRKHPQLATALPIIGAGMGASLPYANRVRLQRINNKLVTDFSAAITRAEKAAATKGALGKAEKAGAVADLEKRMDPSAPIGVTRSRNVDPTVGSQAAGITTGALGSVEGAILPYELDLALPSDSPDRREATNAVNWAERAGQQVLPGGLAGHVGGHMPLPRRGLVPDVERAQGLVRRMTPVAAPRKTKPVVAQTTPEQIQEAAIQRALGMQ